MNQFIKQYGLVVVYAVVGILIITILYGVFRSRWKSVGGIEDGESVKMIEATAQPSNPVLLVKDRSVKVNEKCYVRDGIKAKECSGEDITNNVTVKELQTHKLLEDGRIDTSKTGICKVEFSIISRYGLTTKRKCTILIDDREEGDIK